MVADIAPRAGEEGARRAALGRSGGVALARAGAMRREPTDAERLSWRLFRGKRLAGWKFRRQQPIDPYIVDFLCPAARLIVEADGSQHVEDVHDTTRHAWLSAQGFRVLRSCNSDVRTNPDGVLAAILAALAASPHPGSPPQGGREQKDPLLG